MSDENPSAFPLQANDGCGNFMEPEYGMTLRDWFAGQAVSALVHQVLSSEADARDTPLLVASFAYDIADAMLAARASSRS